MGSLAFWQVSGFCCILFMMFMYSILDGFDLGMGMLLGFVARNDKEKRTLLASIAPFWDGNEVWLVIAASVLFALFPPVYSSLLPSFYLLFTATILIFMCRAISLELSYGKNQLSGPWLALFSVASFLAAFLGILFLAVIVCGVPTTAGGVLRLRPEDVVRLPAAVFTASWLLLLLLHSIAYLTCKSSGALRERLLGCGSVLWLLFVVLLPIGFLLIGLDHPEMSAKPAVLSGVSITILGSVLYRLSLRQARGQAMFASSALAMGGLWTVVGGSVFPSVANPLGQGDPAITIYNSSAPLGTMRLVVTFSLVGMAAIIAYVMYVYGVLGGRRETETE